ARLQCVLHVGAEDGAALRAQQAVGERQLPLRIGGGREVHGWDPGGGKTVDRSDVGVGALGNGGDEAAVALRFLARGDAAVGGLLVVDLLDQHLAPVDAARFVGVFLPGL